MLHRYTFPYGTQNPRMLVDVTNDGEQSSTKPIMQLNTSTARVTGIHHGLILISQYRTDNYVHHRAGAADFQASFGPGRYRVYTCVDFQGDGYDIVSGQHMFVSKNVDADSCTFRALP